eukprot:15458177-Alexandrium_andersonii.AAC.1
MDEAERRRIDSAGLEPSPPSAGLASPVSAPNTPPRMASMPKDTDSQGWASSQRAAVALEERARARTVPASRNTQ